MNHLRTILLILLLLAHCDRACAAFPVPRSMEPVTCPSANIQRPVSVIPASIATTVNKKHRHNKYNEEQTDKYDLSIVSFVLALAAILSLGFAAGTLAPLLAGLGIVLAIVAFIVGGQALNRKQKLKGLAIMGVIIGGVITLKFLAAVIPILFVH